MSEYAVNREGKKVAIHVATSAVGDSICAIPTIRKVAHAYQKQITVFTHYPNLFQGHPYIYEALNIENINEDDYEIFHTFEPLAGKIHHLKYGNREQIIEWRHQNCDIRQYHAMSLGFTLTEDEMECDLYAEYPNPLPYEKYVLIHPTHTWPSRTWSEYKWQKLIDELNERNIPVVAIGKDSREYGWHQVQKPVMNVNIKLGVNLLNDPNCTLEKVRWMMQHQALTFITMDSGLLHLAGTTDVNIIQLGGNIDPRLRAPYRKGNQWYNYTYLKGACNHCGSNMEYNVKEHGTFMATPPLVRCHCEGVTEIGPKVKPVLEEVQKLLENN